MLRLGLELPWVSVLGGGFISLAEQGGGRDEEENNTRCYGVSSFWLVARKDRWTAGILAIWLPQRTSHHSRGAGFGLLSI